MFGEMELLFDSSSDEEVEVVRRRKVYKLRSNFLFESDFEFKERFRMTSEKLEQLRIAVGPLLERQRRGGSLTVKQQLCVALHWLGSGAQYHTIADIHGVSKATVCRCIKSVVAAVNENLFDVVVAWPQDVGSVVAKYYEMANFPHVCGVVDGVLINIDAPHENEEAFVDRHGNHSLNCMFVSGPTCQFFYVSARWPGSVHDSRVLRTSNLFQRMEAGNLFPNAVILGDSGYPLKTWLMTPLHEDPADEGERRYNRRLKATRQTVERSLGILKEKFPCLNHLRVEPLFACAIIKCCAALCNYARQGEEEDVLPYQEEVPEVAQEQELNEHGRPIPAAVLRQRQIVNAMR